MQICLNDLKKVTNINHPTTQYALKVAKGEIGPVCKWEKLSCERHLKDLLRQGTEEFPYVFDETRANRIFDWFSKCCTHVKGIYSGQHINLVAYQKYDLGCLFGWVHKDTGYRRFKYSYNKVARGHAKSTTQSGIAMFGMAGDCYYPPGQPDKKVFEESPNVYCSGYDKTQAKIVWKDARLMGLKSKDIKKRLDIMKTAVTHKTRAGEMFALSKDTDNKDGLSICIAIVDEYHKWKTPEVYNVITSAFGKRPQELINIITTAGLNAENNPCKKEEDTCKKILSGDLINERYFVIIRELEEKDNPHDKNLWQKANPMLQEVKNGNEYAIGLAEQIQTDHDMAYGDNDPDKIREFLTKRCNKWLYDSEDRYMSGCMDKWKELAIPREEYLNLVRGRECTDGIDLSKTTDLTANGHVFLLDDGRWAVDAHGFIAEERARQHERTDRVPYLYWAEQNWCTLTPGDVVDYNYLNQHIRDGVEKEGYQILELDYDPYNGQYCTADMEKEGYTRVEIRQGVQTLSEPTKFFREQVLKGNIVHDGSPLLTWCLSNAVEVRDNNENIKLSKKYKDDSQRIDLIAAIINALSRAMVILKNNNEDIFYSPDI